MRIVFYSHMSQLGNGGVESLLGLVKGLSKTHDCCVVTPSKGDLNIALDNISVENVILPFKWTSNACSKHIKRGVKKSFEKIKQWFANRSFNNKYKNKHIDFLQNYEPDVIYTNTSVINIGVSVAEKLNVPHVWHLREFNFFDIKPDFGHKYLAKYLNKSDRIIVNSNTLKSYYEKFIVSDKIKVIYNGIELNENTREKVIAIGNKPYTFVMVGSLIERKSQIDALKAVKVLKCRGHKLKLHIVGEGPLRAKIELYIKTHGLEEEVVLYGHQINVDSFYNTADCYIMCSEFETFGRVTVEAMLCGLPIIGRDAPYNATKELIRNEIDGWLYKDDSELVKKMEWMIMHQNLGAKMGEAGEKWARDNFSLKHCVQQIEKILMSDDISKLKQ